MCLTAGVAGRGAGSFVCTDTRITFRDGFADPGGKVRSTGWGWATGAGPTYEPWEVSMNALRDAGQIPLYQDNESKRVWPGCDFLDRAEKIVFGALAANGMGDGSPGHFLIIEPHSGVLCLQAGKAVERDIGGCFPRGLEQEEEARFEAMRLSVIEAGEDLATQIRAVACHFASASRSTISMSDTMEIGFILSPPAEAPVKGFLRGRAEEIAKTEPGEILERFKANPRERMPLDPCATSTRMYSRLDTASKLQTGVTATATAADGNAGIESQRTATQKSAQAAGTGAHGITGEEIVRGGDGGYGVPAALFHSAPIYDSSGGTLLIDPVARAIQTSLKYADGVTGIDSLKPAQANADHTASNTAAAIASQGALATLSAADFATQVTGAAKPDNNADVTSAHTSNDTANVSGTAAATVKGGAVRANAVINASNQVLRAASFDDSKFALQADTNDGTTGVSTAINRQGSIIPTPVDQNLFSYNAGGATSPAAMWIAWTWTTITIYMPDGTTIVIAASTSLPAPPTPTLSQVAGGSLAARTRFVRIGYTKNGLIYRVGAEASIAILINKLLYVTSPASVAGMDGWVPLVGATTSTEFTQSPRSPASPVAFGTDWTEPPAGANITATTAYDSTWLTGVVSTILNAVTQYWFYPYWDIGASLVVFPDKGLTTKTAASSNNQNKDGRISLAATAMQGLTPAAGNAGSGNTGSGKML
jgi:hypothetical protein